MEGFVIIVNGYTIRTTKNDRKLENTVKLKKENWCDNYGPL